jgi:hypothetical protein
MKLARQNEADECFLEALKLRKTKEDLCIRIKEEYRFIQLP